MNSVVSDKPYVPVPPYRGTLWPRAMYLYVPRYLRLRYGTSSVEVEGAEKLSASIAAGHGILLTPNHCRDEDPFILSMLAKKVRRPFFVVASAHLFMGNKLQAFLLRRAGAFSIYREGMDKQAVQTSIEIIETAERPLVIFPEGHISRTNDRLTPMLEGTALIARQAAKKRAKENKKVVVHPIATRYSFPFDVQAAAARMLDEIETRLTWPPSRERPLFERLKKVAAGLLALKELQYLGDTQDGTINERIPKLIDVILRPLESEWVNGHDDGHPVARVKRLRAAILPDMIKGDLSEAETARRWRLLEDANLAQQLYHYPPGYVTEDSPKNRIIETVERFEEDLTGKVTVHGPVEAKITVGDAIEVSTSREARGDSDPLMAAIEGQLRTMLEIPVGGSRAMTIAPWPEIAVRAGLVVAGVLAWYASQAFLGKRVPKVAHEVPLTDGMHVFTARLHERYATNVAAGNRLLIISSLVIDLLGVYLLCSAIFGPSIRPYLGLAMVFTLRQICQVLCPLPAPAGMVWRYPGVPAVLVTYGTANDLFFSGHTAIAVYAAATLAGDWGPWGLAIGLAIALFEATTVLILRAHYTMDVFTGIVSALWVYSLSGTLAPWVDDMIRHWVG